MTRILVTIGPASANERSIGEFAKYTNLFRLNGSHNTIDWHQDTVAKIRKIVPDAFILLDVPGAKPRTSNSGPVSIIKDEIVVFGVPDEGEERSVVGLTKPLPDIASQSFSVFSVNDGQFLFDVVDITAGYVAGRSRGDFELMPKKGLNLPGSVYSEDLQLRICKDFIHSVKDLNVDGYGLSFIQNGAIVDELRDIAANKVLVSKIENSEGLKNTQNIISRSDAVMIDRGDLAAEIGFDALYNAVEQITHNTKVSGKPLIMATENLESMSERDTPSKSEVMSLAHSVSIGADCVMLSEETATAINGSYIVNWLHEFLKNANISVRDMSMLERHAKYETIWKMIGEHRQVPALLMSKSGYALFNYMATRPNHDVTIVTDNPRIKQITKFYSNHISVITANIEDSVPIETIWNVIRENSEVLFEHNDHLAAVYVSKYVKGARANSITLFHKEDFLDTKW